MAQDFLDGKNAMLDDTTALKDATRYYIDTRKGIIQPTTIRTYIILAENAFRCLQKTRLCDLRPIDIQRAISIESKRASPKYVKNAYCLFKSVLKMFESFHPSQCTACTTHIPCSVLSGGYFFVMLGVGLCSEASVVASFMTYQGLILQIRANSG